MNVIVIHHPPGPLFSLSYTLQTTHYQYRHTDLEGVTSEKLFGSGFKDDGIEQICKTNRDTQRRGRSSMVVLSCILSPVNVDSPRALEWFLQLLPTEERLVLLVVMCTEWGDIDGNGVGVWIWSDYGLRCFCSVVLVLLQREREQGKEMEGLGFVITVSSYGLGK